jgi:hypothetical protein
MNAKHWVVSIVLLAAVFMSWVDWPFERKRSIQAKASAPLIVTPARSAPQPAETSGPRQPHPAPKPNELRELTIKQLGNFDYETDKKIPEDVHRLNGMSVRLSGFMIITNESEHIHEFALVPSFFSCCYGQPPALQHVVVVSCPKDHPVEYSDGPINVEGTLTVKELKEEGYVTSVFQVAAKDIKAAK